jgi:hypothetical protein
MATASEIVTRAFRRAGLFDPLETPSSIDMQTGQEALTAMINSWEASGLSGDVLPLDARFEQAVVAMLGVRLSEEYGKAPGAVMLRDAENGWQSLQGAYFALPESQFESGLLYTGHYSRWPYILSDLEDVVISDAWRPETAYNLRAFVTNGANLYELVTAGKSAAGSGPSGTSADIVDGTCVWCWRRVLAR